MASVVNPTVKAEVLDDQDQEKYRKHHNFSFSVLNRRPCSVSGTMNQTVLEALESSEKFKSHVEKNQKKDISIVRKKPHHADIATHFPCCLIEQGEELTIRLSLKISVPEPDERALKSEQLVTFYVSRAGGPNFKRKHLKNMGNQDIPYLCIYAYQGETVKKALQRDGRFEKIAYEEGSELFCIEDSLTVEMCYRVNELMDGKRYRLKKEKTFSAGTLESGSRPADQPAGPSESGSRRANQAAGSLQEQAKSTSESEKLEPVKPLVGEKRKLYSGQEKSNRKKPCSRDHHPITGSEELLQELKSQFKGLLEIMKGRENLKTDEEALELLRLEYGKNTEPLWDVETGECLMKKSKSVCYIINKEINQQGTGFLLFDRFVLTNAHLILENGKIGDPVKIIQPRAIDIHVDFNYEPSKEKERNSNVEGVVFGAYGRDKEMGYLDYALLELSEKFENLPPPLLKQYSPFAKGGVCIFGHPESKKKKFDFCSLITPEQRPEVMKKNQYTLQLIKADCNVVAKDSPVFTYDTCFFHGSSGSPIFNANGEVFAMHSGGYAYKICRTMSVIEYAIPLELIVDHLMKNLKSNPDIVQKIKNEANDHLQHIIAKHDELMQVD